MTLTEIFDKCTETKLMKDGSVQIHCKRGLWSVSGKSIRSVQREAVHYLRQYLDDGEYVTLLEPTGQEEITNG